ncbi:hypothetical protein OG373_40095 [Streptomyces avidinii]|uniref:hypothetical protein n=1 Tax=Streptomyces avidinii TaxID=1895 RepID=UPI00386C4FC0|nr:hypothetical protein OG373_40095 [Streptomyces avidinii]
MQYATGFDDGGHSRFMTDGLWGYADTSGTVEVEGRHLVLQYFLLVGDADRAGLAGRRRSLKPPLR